MLGDINNGDMTYYCTKKKRFNLAGSSFKEILPNLRKFYLSFKEMCEIGSESPAVLSWSCRVELPWDRLGIQLTFLANPLGPVV